jgi:shikimate dehydrogenase
VIFNAAFEAGGTDAVFVAFEVGSDDVAAAIAGAAALGFVGLSVTMPDKEAAVSAVDEVSPQAARLGAVNSIGVRSGRTVGHNTDGVGFLDALSEEASFRAEGCRAGVLGAGGAARAVVLALAEAGAAEVVVVNRSEERARRAAELHPAARVGGTDELAGVDLLVNATPVGMGADDELPVPPEAITGGQVVCDLVYWPERTPLMRVASARGATTLGGLGMLVHQAAHSYRLWLDEDPPLAAMRRAATDALPRER